MFPTYLAVITCLSVQLSGACFTPGKTWSYLEAEVIENLIGINSVSDCQKECSLSNIRKCSHFTWYTEDSNYPGVCTLFQSVPDLTEDCSSCISGPGVCATCSKPYLCQTNSSTILEIAAASAENECQARCSDREGCEFYTWYNELSPIFGYQCFLLTSCTPAGPCQDCVTGPKVCPSTGGGVLFMGGVVNGSRSGNVELIGDCYVAIEDLPEAGVEGAAAAIKDGSVFHCGGWTNSGYSNRCYIREESGVWTQGPSMNTARGYFTLNSVGSKLVAIGGYSGDGGRLDTVEVLESSVWQVAGFKINQERESHCAVTISDSSVLLVGGSDGIIPLKTTEELDIDSGAVTPYADLPYGIAAHSCAPYTGQILVSGGVGGDSTSVYSLDYKSEGSDWVLLNHMEHGRYYHTMHVVDSVLTVYGGDGGESTLEELVRDSWESKPMKNRRFEHSSIVMC